MRIEAGFAFLFRFKPQAITFYSHASVNLFDEIVIRLDKDLRGHGACEVIDLITAGIEEIDTGKKVRVIPDENDTLRYVLINAKKGSVITICCKDISTALRTVMKYKDEEDKWNKRWMMP